jgi:hypothetical protein
METHLKRIVILKYDCWLYANRLWNDMAIHAMGLELGAQVRPAPPMERSKILRPLYELYAQFMARVVHPTASMFAWGGTIRYLPPSAPLPEKYKRFRALYLLGILFRNPAGFEKYGKELRVRFGASAAMTERIKEQLAPLSGRTYIGIEIRQRPFKYFPKGEFLIPLSRTKQVLEEYLWERGLQKDEVGLVIVSDLPLPPGLFAEYAHILGSGVPSFDFHLLAHTSAIIGTNSSTSNLPAWFGNVPHVVVLEAPIDWECYRDKTEYFENPYATFTQVIPRNELP